MTNPLPKLSQLAALLRDVADNPNVRHIASYAGAIAELAHLHDAIERLPLGSPERMRAFDATRRPWKAATVFAAKYGLQHPTQVLLDMGYRATIPNSFH
jgi:hypothetical protein